jgi:hypothetical protein
VLDVLASLPPVVFWLVALLAACGGTALLFGLVALASRRWT